MHRPEPDSGSEVEKDPCEEQRTPSGGRVEKVEEKPDRVDNRGVEPDVIE